ncbi:BlaI/MecI/CopY family transcriptional regulator [Prevotella sp. KH2C16]|uniref:BlaI/MecI/CopY family transcriptional regulator n=1 Tax=Prevotella sp. KH2C16 TaxID=1855325 RepID=UPI0008E1E0F4|nr:BlaI/MecI/CopY family transcriptional regulator [Prevotella sp. KH2C16]SFG65308.1 Predicted transcriptional regulator [Prevotella sp. KH2C16]
MERLTTQEEDIMQIVWTLGQCTVREIVDRMAEPKSPYTTVASVVGNLKAKGYVAQSRKGNTYLYMPTIAENEYKSKFMSGFVRDYFRNSFKEMVSFFARDEKLSPRDLRDIISEIEKGGK